MIVPQLTISKQNSCEESHTLSNIGLLEHASPPTVTIRMINMMSSNRVLLAKNASIKSCANPTNSITETVVEYCRDLIHPLSHPANITPPTRSNSMPLSLTPNHSTPKPDTRSPTTHQIKPWQRGHYSSAGRQLLQLAPGCRLPRNAASTGISATSRNARVIPLPKAS